MIYTSHGYRDNVSHGTRESIYTVCRRPVALCVLSNYDCNYNRDCLVISMTDVEKNIFIFFFCIINAIRRTGSHVLPGRQTYSGAEHPQDSELQRGQPTRRRAGPR